MTQTHALENLRHGADVYSSDGKKLGTLHAVVVDPRDDQVTHIAVNTGPHFPEPGFGAPNVVSVEMESLRDAGEDRVDLGVTAAQFRELPLYEHRHFFDVPEDEEPAPPGEQPKGVRRIWSATLALAAALARINTGAIPAEHFRKASFERHIMNDAPVWRVEPDKHIGNVERVLVDEATDEIEALVIKRGVLFKEDVVLPMNYVTEISDGVIRAEISDADIEKLEPFRAD